MISQAYYPPSSQEGMGEVKIHNRCGKSNIFYTIGTADVHHEGHDKPQLDLKRSAPYSGPESF